MINDTHHPVQDPEHPRAGMKEALKEWCQTAHTECLAQLAVFKPAREVLLQDGSVVPALEAVAQAGLSEAARELAAAALAALSDKKLMLVTEGQKHVMLSCERALVFKLVRDHRSFLTHCVLRGAGQINGMCKLLCRG